MTPTMLNGSKICSLFFKYFLIITAFCDKSVAFHQNYHSISVTNVLPSFSQTQHHPIIIHRSTTRSSTKQFSRFNRKGNRFDFNGRKRPRVKRGFGFSLSNWKKTYTDSAPLKIQRSLVYINICLFIYQVVSAVWYTPQLNEALIKSASYSGPTFSRLDILRRNIVGAPNIIVRGSPIFSTWNPFKDSRLRQQFASYTPIIASSLGPLTMGFIHSMKLSLRNPHRLLTAGFLHGSILHLFFNMNYLWKLPTWLEAGLGANFYLASYCTSIVSGNIAHSLFSPATSASLGASGGICGLIGVYFIMLRKVGRNRQSILVLKNMLFLLLFGILANSPSNYLGSISNASHVGGFLAGCIFTVLFAPTYRSSYSAKRKIWFNDYSSDQMRRIMGPNLVECPAWIDMKWFWGFLLFLTVSDPRLQTAPVKIIKGLINPSSLNFA